MPAQGTRKVELEGQTTYLPKDAAELTELLRQGCALQRQVEYYNGQLVAVKGKLAAIASDRRGGGATVHLAGADGRGATVVWRKRTEVDAARAEELRKVLGPQFHSVFETRVTYTLAKTYRSWMDKAQGVLERVKGTIAKAVSINESAPSVTLQDVG